MILGKSLLQQLTATKAPSPPSTPPHFCFLPLNDFTFPDLYQIILLQMLLLLCSEVSETPPFQFA